MSKTVADLSNDLPSSSGRGGKARWRGAGNALAHNPALTPYPHPQNQPPRIVSHVTGVTLVWQLEGMTAQEQQKLAMKALDLQTPTVATYRRNALQLLTGKKAKPVYRKLKSMATMKSLTATLKGIGVGSSETKEDEQMIRFHEQSIEVLENIGTFKVPLTRSGGDLESEVQVQVKSYDISATAGKDYVALDGETVTFAKGELTASVDITIIDDDTWEKNENFRIELENPSEGAKIDDRARRASSRS